MEHEIWLVRGRLETRVPGETYHTIIVEAEGFEPLRVGMWHGEAIDHPDFGPIMDRLAALARAISRGVAK